ncbi:MAG: LysM peptidoglycan-binding domain-containing protein [Pseudomonadota bacterium]|nr:LysM peptidoglycan-binding domain-containing protein [Pseudomonadota bacterium]
MLVGWLSLSMAVAMAQEGTTAMGGAAGAPDFYVIQNGDTLWDISTRFLGDAYVWPELWSVNEYITNPHWIYPGNRIYFRLGDALNPPSAGVNDTGTLADGYTPPVRVEEAAEVACDFPPLYDRRYDGVKLSAPGFLGDEDTLELRGTVYSADTPAHELGEGNILYLDLTDTGDVDCGTLLAIYRRQGSKVKGADGPIGHVYRVLGVAQVLRVDDHIVTASVRDSWSEIEHGDLVGTPIAVDLEVDVTAPQGDTEATIIARLSDEQRLASTGETVFLDRGTNDGVDVGTSLYLVERRDGPNPDGKEDERLPERVVGRVVVVRAEPGVATGVVVDAARDVQIGLRAVATVNAE